MRKFFLLAALLASLPTLADTFESGGFTYTTSGDSASLTTGANVSEVVIPQTVTNEGVTYTVTQVGTEAFYGMWKVEKVTFPNTLEILGESAFDDCSNLVSAPLPKSLQRMEGYCFYGCPLQEVEVPEGCTFIGSYNWAQCSYLKTISLPSTLLELGTGVFSGTPILRK